MLCEICHENEAHITYTEIINGVKKEQHLCESCAAKQAPFNLMGKLGPEVQFGNILSGLLQNFARGLSMSQEKESICGRCGMTASEFAKNGILGCPDCYNAFAPLLDKNLRTMQGAVENKGKRPMNAVIFEQTQTLKPRDAETAAGGEETAGFPGEVLGTAGTIDDILGEKETPKKAMGTKKRTGRKLTSTNVKQLRKRMEKAVQEEDYEEAARIRDRIRELENGGK